MNELVSIIVPVYNAEDFLEASINTLLKQTYRDIEILLIDDGSTDKSLEVCTNLSLRDPRCRVIHKENGGVSHTRNLGIQEANGEYIMFFDSDDFLEENAVETCVTTIRENGTDAVFFGMFFDTYKNNHCIKQTSRCIEKSKVISKEEICSNFQSLVDNNYISPIWNKLIKKSIIIDNAVQFNINLTNYEDFLFSLRILECMEVVSVITDKLYHYVRREREGLSRRFVNGYDEKIEILISETEMIFDRIGFNTKEGQQYIGGWQIYWMTLVLMNCVKESTSLKNKISKIKKYINNPVIKDRFSSKDTTNKFAKLIRFFVCHNMPHTVCLLCTIKMKYKEKNY